MDTREDPWSRPLPTPPAAPAPHRLAGLRVGVPAGHQLDFDGDGEAAAAFELARERLRTAGASLVEVDLAPFLEAGDLLYDGPWVAERTVAIDGFLAQHPDALHPVTRSIFERADLVTGSDVFRGLHALEERRLQATATWAVADVLLLPTVPTTPTVARLLEDPIGANTLLGRYTNFVNLLDLAGLAVPSTTGSRGVPVGVTFLAPAGQDALLLAVGSAWERLCEGEGTPEPSREAPAAPGGSSGDPRDLGDARVAVVGAHLAGEPLHGALLALGATLECAARTAPEYRLFALAQDATPTGAPAVPVARPGLLRVPAGGEPIAAEVYRVPLTALGALVASVPAPLGIGTVRLEDGTAVLGFLCEAAGTHDALDITEHGGWRAYRRAGSSHPAGA